MAFNTGNAVPSDKAKDLSDNAENLDSSVNTQALTWTDRLGVVRDTVHGRITKMGYTVPVAYAASIAFTVSDNVKTVDENGIVYAPLPSALPFTTTGTWGVSGVSGDNLKFIIAQGVTVQSIIDDSSQAYEFVTFNEAINFTSLVGGKVLHIKDRNGVSSIWDTVSASSVTPNTDGIVLSIGSPTIAIVLRNKDINTEESIASVIQTTNGFNDIDPVYIAELKALGDIASDSDSVTIARKAIKAWKKPTGIKDSAVAASFGLNNGVSEPGTQVSGFPTIDQIGIQQSRDAVVVFGQVDSAPALLVTSNTTYTTTTIVSPDFAAIWDEIEVGLICDVNFGTAGWVGAVVTSKSGTDTLNIQSWRNIDGVSGLATTPTNGQPLTIDRHNAVWGANFNAIIPAADSGANQAIGIEVGLSCTKAGTGAISKGFYAVNLGGERPEFAYAMTGGWSKGYTSIDANIYGFSSSGDGMGLTVSDSTGNAIQTEDPAGHHIECRDTSSSAQFIVKNDGKVLLGKNAESGTARLNLRGAGDFTEVYDQTEIAIFDPTSALVDRQGFFVSQAYGASTGAASFKMGVGNSANHTYQFTMNTQGVDRMTFHSSGDIHAGVDNTQSMGVSYLRWSEIFAGNGVINTSDETLKTKLVDFTVKETCVAIKLKSLLKTFKWINSAEREESGGKKARVHVGIGAQSLGQAFIDEGLNPNDYAMFCYDEWEDIEGVESGNRYGVRLEQVLAFIIANT